MGSNRETWKSFKSPNWQPRLSLIQCTAHTKGHLSTAKSHSVLCEPHPNSNWQFNLKIIWRQRSRITLNWDHCLLSPDTTRSLSMPDNNIMTSQINKGYHQIGSWVLVMCVRETTEGLRWKECVPLWNYKVLYLYPQLIKLGLHDIHLT